MINILYYDREMIYKTLAESLVIGGLPMNKYKATTEGLTEEIKFCESVIKFLDKNKDKTIILKDEDDREYLGVENVAYWQKSRPTTTTFISPNGTNYGFEDYPQIYKKYFTDFILFWLQSFLDKCLGKKECPL